MRLCALSRVLLLSCFVCLMPAAEARQAATPAPASISVLSLIGDRLDIVSRDLNTGTRISRNLRNPVALDTPVFDTSAVLAANKAIRKVLPAAEVTQLSTRSPILFEKQRTLFDIQSGSMSMPDAIRDAVRAQGATHFLLIAKHRADPDFKFVGGTVDGRDEELEGLGFYLDGTQQIQTFDNNHQRTAVGRGFIAPYVHVSATLVEFPSGRVLGRKFVTENLLAGSGRSGGDINEPWLAMTSAEKVKWLNHLIEKHLGEAVEALVASARPGA